jgi:hypothetical protein
MTPQHALRMALGAEKRAQAFFEHVLLIERMLESTPDPVVHWQDLYEA